MPHWLHRYDALTRMALWLPFTLFIASMGLLILHLWQPASRKWVWKALLGIGGPMFLIHPLLALYWAPPERFMGDVYRIAYVHVPQILMCMAGFTINFVCCVAYLFKKSWVTDSLGEASASVSLFFGTVGIILGSIWAKPTWGTYWTDDPRLNSTAIMLIVYLGYVTMRRFIEDAEKRATWSAVLGILAAASVPLTYFAVNARSIHQKQSNPDTVDTIMTMVWRWSYVTFFCLFIVLIYQRFLQAQLDREKELAGPEDLPVESGAVR